MATFSIEDHVRRNT